MISSSQAMREAFVSEIKIKKILPCLADSSKIRIIAKFDRDIREILPYLNASIEGAIYIKEKHTLTFSKKETLITLYPHEVKMAKVDDEKRAGELVSWLQKTINEIWNKRDEIKPLFERRNELKPLDVYRYLPQLNCGKCGEENCLAFALKIIQREKSVLSCSPLFTNSELSARRYTLLKLLRETGYPTPNAF
jgi:ArsR family metal-binding transcriptional regulator